MDDQRLIADLKAEVETLRDIIKRAIPCAFHSKECDYNIAPSKLCNCWVIDAYAHINPPAIIRAKVVDIDSAAICKYCSDTFKYHTCKMGAKLGCSKVNCPCEDFIN